MISSLLWYLPMLLPISAICEKEVSGKKKTEVKAFFLYESIISAGPYDVAGYHLLKQINNKQLISFSIGHFLFIYSLIGCYDMMVCGIDHMARMQDSICVCVANAFVMYISSFHLRCLLILMFTMFCAYSFVSCVIFLPFARFFFASFKYYSFGVRSFLWASHSFSVSSHLRFWCKYCSCVSI